MTIYGWTRKGGDKRFIYEQAGKQVCVDMITTDRKHPGKGWSCVGQLDRWVRTISDDPHLKFMRAVEDACAIGNAPLPAEPSGYTWPDPNRRGGRKRHWRK